MSGLLHIHDVACGYCHYKDLVGRPIFLTGKVHDALVMTIDNTGCEKLRQSFRDTTSGVPMTNDHWQNSVLPLYFGCFLKPYYSKGLSFLGDWA